MYELPQATETDKKNGWTLSYDFLMDLSECITKKGCDVSLEDIETILLTLNKMISK